MAVRRPGVGVIGSDMDAPAYDEDTCREALAALGALIESGVLGEASRLRQLLRYLVIEELEDRGDRLKAYSIATDVFGRGDDFDPNTDSIVRVEVHRLRQALDHYYATKGAEDRIRIEIPKGSYRPIIRAAAPEGGPTVAEVSPQRSRRFLAVPLAAAAAALLLGGIAAWYILAGTAWRSGPGGSTEPFIALEVLPFADASDGAPQDDLAASLTDEFIIGLSRIKALRVVVRAPAHIGRAAGGDAESRNDAGIGYVVRGSVQHFSGSTRVVVQLIEARSGTLLWAQSYKHTADDSFAAQEQLVATIASELRPQIFNATKRALEPQDPDSLTAWELYIQATWIPGVATSSLAWEKERVALAERALALRPDFGQAHAVLADKLAYLANVDPLSDTPALREQAAFHAKRALELAAQDADVLFNVSVHHWHAGRLLDSALATRRTLELDPNHALARMLAETVPYTCASPPQAILQRTVTYDAALSPDNPARWVTLTWIGILYMNSGNFLRAAEAERRSQQIFSTPDSTLRFAAILQRLGRTAEALALVDGLRKDWPNLDVRRYAEVTIPRRCGNEPGARLHHALFSALADAVEARS